MPVKSWVPLEESLQPLLDQINIIPHNNLNICPSPSPPSARDKCSPPPTSREFSLQQWLLQKTTTIIAQMCGAQCQWICLQKTPTPKAQGTFPNRGWKEPEDQGVCCKNVSPGDVSSYTYEVSPSWLPAYTGAEGGQSVFSREEHTDWLSRTTRPALKEPTWATLCRLSRL